MSKLLTEAVEKTAPAAPAAPDPKIKEAQLNLLISRTLPIRLGFQRRVHHLWDNKYRVNFHDTDRDNQITQSYFITVTDKVEIGG